MFEFAVGMAVWGWLFFALSFWWALGMRSRVGEFERRLFLSMKEEQRLYIELSRAAEREQEAARRLGYLFPRGLETPPSMEDALSPTWCREGADAKPR